ncbi:hypothetical protein Q1695_010696 [Nippostrongylus brasiliensis]|nr:hypothetical protein Q1695_010696 [Nippostrongylus brasiliensis]
MAAKIHFEYAVYGGYFMGLGANMEERAAALDRLTRERVTWRAELFKGLQKALTDVRGTPYDQVNKKWGSYSRQRKRTLEDTEDVDNIVHDME